jgi:hypothetical protein
VDLPTARAVKSFLPLVSAEEVLDRVSAYRLLPVSVRKNGLSKVVPRQAQRQKIQVDIVRLEAHYAEVIQHPVYVWLIQNPAFKKAFATFNKFALSRAREAGSRFSSQFAEYRFAQFRFLYLIVPIVWHFLLREKHNLHPAPVARNVLAKAAKQAIALRKSMKAGAKLEEYEDQRRLEQLLDALTHRLDVWTAPRALPRNDRSWPARHFLARVIRILSDDFGRRLPNSVYGELAAGIGYNVEPKELRAQRRAVLGVHTHYI